MAHLPAARVSLGEERQHLFAICLRPNVLRVFRHVADKEVWVTEHYEVLLCACLLVRHQLFARHVQQFERHASCIADAVKLRVGVAIGQAHQRLPGLARLGENTLAQGRVEIRQHTDFGFHATVSLGVCIAQVARAFAMLVNDTHRRLDDALGHCRFTGGYLLSRRHRAAVLPGKPGHSDQPAQ